MIGLREFFSALAACALGALLGAGLMFAFAASAQAHLAEDIVCGVFGELDEHGLPISTCKPNTPPENPGEDPGDGDDTGEEEGQDETPNPNIGGGGSSSSGGGGSGRGSEGDEDGEVLGASYECNEDNLFLTSYMRMGRANDREEVMKLQAFLNGHIDANLPITGYFGPRTHEAVKSFQLKYWEEILLPWVAYGLSSAQTPTGYVYKTTLRTINKLACPTLELPEPELP